jgi:DNA-binding IclR family transcriptional regulator
MQVQQMKRSKTPEAAAVAASVSGLRWSETLTTTRTLSRGLDVLEALASADEFGLGPSAVAENVGLDKATVTRLLRTLIEAGYVSQDEASRRYRLTGKILRLAHGLSAQMDLQRVARPHLKRLLADVGETVHLGVREGLAVFYVDKLVSDNSIQLVSAVGQTMPLHTTSLGKSILAALPGADREALYLQIDFAPRTARTIRSVEQFREEIARTQARGYAIDDRENEDFGACVAAAILGADGKPVGAVSVSGPDFRVRNHFCRFGLRVREAALAIAWELGAEAAAPGGIDGGPVPAGSPEGPALPIDTAVR